MSRILILTSDHVSEQASALASRHFPKYAVLTITDRDAFDRATEQVNPHDILLSFCTNIIVPSRVIRALDGKCYNVHPAPPEYPGRDPHHFAVYDGISEYGATAHVMTEEVDAGTILCVKRFQIPQGTTPTELMGLADKAGLELVDWLLASLAAGNVPTEAAGRWGARKTSRNDFRRLCRVSPIAYEAEFERRKRAVHSPRFRNGHVELHGRVFRETDERAEDLRDKPRKEWADFTESAYCELLDTAKDRYRFATYGAPGDDDHVLWRHDIDYSVHRSVRLAELEAERGLVATYFFWLRAPYYNVLEPAVRDAARRIVSLGHRVGLHFDINGYGETTWDYDTLQDRVGFEAELLRRELGVDLDAVSFHDPENGSMLNFDADHIADLVNAYSASLKSNYTYASDSNGYWRFSPILDVLKAGHQKLHILTHPAWWTPNACAPRDKIERAILGRARAVMAEYDDHLRRSGRTNRY